MIIYFIADFITKSHLVQRQLPGLFCGFCLLSAVGLLMIGPAYSAPPGSSAHTLADNQTHGSSPGKPNAGLAVTSASKYRLQTGQVQIITLSLSSAIEQGVLRLGISVSSADLEIMSPTQYEVDLGQQPEPSFTLELLPHQPGRYYLMLDAEIENDGTQSQSLAVLVEAGDGQVAPHSSKAAPTSGVISLPAQETGRRP